MTPCEYTKQHIQAYFNGVLDFIQRGRIEKHFRECTKCQKLHEEMFIDRLWRYGLRNVYLLDIKPDEDCLSAPTIEEYVEGRLTEEEKKKVEDHLTKCSFCREGVESYKAVPERETKYQEAEQRK